DPTLGPAVRQTHEGALPAHQHGQSGDLAQADVEVISEAALGRSQDGAVVDPISLEDLSLSVVHPDRNRYNESPSRIPKSLVNVRLKLKLPSDSSQLSQCLPVQMGPELCLRAHLGAFRWRSVSAGVWT